MDAVGVTGDWVETATKRLQHDVNCLEHPERAKRRRAIRDLGSKLRELGVIDTEERSVEAQEVSMLIRQTLMKPLVGRIEDDSESCREAALELIASVCKRLDAEDSNSLLVLAVPMIASRLSKSEPSEEVRLQYMVLLHLLIQRTSSGFVNVIEDLVLILLKSLADPFPDLKIESCAVLMELCSAGVGLREREHGQGTENVFSPHFESIGKTLLANLKHQRSRVRVEALQAICACIRHGSTEVAFPDWSSDMWPLITSLTQDRSSSVRSCLSTELVCCLKKIPNMVKAKRYSVLLALIGLSSDVQPEVQEQATKDISELAHALYSEGDRDQDFEHLMICDHLEFIVPPTVLQLHDWTSGSRLAAIRLLSAVIRYARTDITSFADTILQACMKTISDEDHVVAASVVRCCSMLGESVGPEAILDVILAALFDQRSGQVSCLFETCCLRVLRFCLEGCIRGSCDEELLASQCRRLRPILDESTFCMSDDATVRRSTLELVDSLVAHLPSNICSQTESDFFWALVQLDASDNSSENHESVHSIASRLGSSLGSFSAEDLFARHFPSSISRIVCNEEDSTATTKSSTDMQVDLNLDLLLSRFVPWTSPSHPRLRLFTSLLGRASGSPVLAHQLHMIVPIVASCAKKDVNVAVRVIVLRQFSGVLEAIGGSRQRQMYRDWTLSILRTVLLPNIIWRIGREEAVARLAACSGVRACLDHDMLSKDIVNELREELLPPLSSCLDDFDVPIRLETTRAFSRLLPLVELLTDEERMRHLYGELLKRLDDSDDDVRVAACAAISAFIACCLPRELDHDQHYRTILNSALVHLDDPSNEVQTAVFDMMQSVCTFDLQVFVDEVSQAGKKHSSPRLCEQLLSIAQRSS